MNWLRLDHLEAADPIVIKDSDGRVVEVQVPCEPTQRRIPMCCFKAQMDRHGKRQLRVRDRRLDPAPTWLLVNVQRWKCGKCGRVHNEELPDLHDTHRVTNRLYDDIALSAIKRTFEDAATFHAVESTLVKRIFKSVAAEKLQDYRFQCPRVLGVDEKFLKKRARWVAYDVENATALELLPGRDETDIRALLCQAEDPERVEVFCQDMYFPYRNLAGEFFPKALIVIDKFHVVRMANEAMDEARRAVQAQLEPEDRVRMANMRRLFLKRWDDLDRNAQDRLAEVVELHEVLKLSYTWKEKFFDIFEMEGRTKAEQALMAWQGDMPSSIRKFFRPIKRNLKVWGTLIFNYFDASYTSAGVENFNGLLDRMNADGYGYSFDQLRAKALLKYGNLVPKADLRMYFDDFDLEPRPLTYSLGTGIPLSTMIDDLEAHTF